MERTFGDVGQRVETQPELGQSMSRQVGRTVDAVGSIGGELARGGEALQSALKKGAVAIGNGIQDGRDEVIAYTRRQPVGALTAAAGVGFVVGLCLAVSSRAVSSGRSGWLPRSTSRRSYLGRPAAHGWRSFLGLP
ncbi:MAG TPA: hypothetical protein VLK35_16490 [Methylomirabilota bacterium]|nr:hypothetical protein [Methylomirabilota bacterium]